MNPQNQKQTPNTSVCTTAITAATGSTSSSSSNRACAACKYQRRRCSPDCPIAPFFPATKPNQDFRNAQRLFGVSNIAKTIKSLPPEHREAAVKSMVYQANARAADPVGGCLGIIRELQVQIHRARVELKSVLHNLSYFRTVQEEEEENIIINPDFQFYGYNGELRVGSNAQLPLDNGFSTGLFDHNVSLSSSSKGKVEKQLRNHRSVKLLETESSSEKGAKTTNHVRSNVQSKRG